MMTEINAAASYIASIPKQGSITTEQKKKFQEALVEGMVAKFTVYILYSFEYSNKLFSYRIIIRIIGIHRILFLEMVIVQY